MFSIKSFDSLKYNLVFQKLKYWDSTISFFIKFNIWPSFSDINKNRLKNVFCSIIEDLRVWREINFMLSYNLLDFNCNSLYSRFFCGNFNSLSLLLFDIYISEFDFYVFNLSRFFFYKYVVYKDLFYSLKKNNIRILPLFLSRFKILSNNNYFILSKNSFSYNKSINYLRYVGYFFFGIIGSIFFTKKLEIKFISFIKGNLLMEIHDITIFSSFDRNIVLGGFHISFFYNHFGVTDIINKKKFLNNSIFLKLNKFKLNMTKSFVTRFYFEFLFRLSKLDFIRIQKKSLLNYKKVLLFFLFSESLRLFNFRDSQNLLINLSLTSQNFYIIYCFNNYLFVFKKILSSFENNFFPVSILPLDLAFNSILVEFKSKFLLINNDLLDLFHFKIKYIRSYCLSNRSFFSGVLFSIEDLLSFSYYFYSLKCFLTYDARIRLSIPLKIIIYRLRLIGIFHFFKNRPIGSNFFMFQEDDIIFQFFSYFFLACLIWYNNNLIANYSNVYFVYKILFRSCLLTISRKHNKSLSWSYSLYRYLICPTKFESYSFLSIHSSRYKLFNEIFFLSL